MEVGWIVTKEMKFEKRKKKEIGRKDKMVIYPMRNNSSNRKDPTVELQYPQTVIQ